MEAMSTGEAESEQPTESGRRAKPGRRPGRPRDPKAHRAILEATLTTLQDSGYPSLTLEEIARRARVGKATIYRHWESKLDLVLEAASPHLAIGVVPDTGDTGRDVRVGLDQIITTYSDPVAAIVIFAVLAGLEPDQRLRQRFRSAYVLPWRASMAAALERGVTRHDLPADLDIAFTVDLIVGTVFQRVLVVSEPLIEGLAEHLCELVLHGQLPTG
jgi:AcrR family transcriptional regulator